MKVEFTRNFDFDVSARETIAYKADLVLDVPEAHARAAIKAKAATAVKTEAATKPKADGKGS